ncbi:MAG: LPXTG cell wall anchor domain-containing protein [Clostridiales bacterium]|nr:LPXTG cell wall anchor domain-containing protein [Clostridiales bacterium]
MRKKLLAIIATAAMLVTMIPALAFAEGEPWQIGETKYGTLADAVAGAGADATIELVGEYSGAGATLAKNLTLDLGGNNCDLSSALSVTSGAVKIIGYGQFEGDISVTGDGSLEIDSGSFKSDVGAYMATDSVMFFEPSIEEPSYPYVIYPELTDDEAIDMGAMYKATRDGHTAYYWDSGSMNEDPKVGELTNVTKLAYGVNFMVTNPTGFFPSSGEWWNGLMKKENSIGMGEFWLDENTKVTGVPPAPKAIKGYEFVGWYPLVAGQLEWSDVTGDAQLSKDAKFSNTKVDNATVVSGDEDYIDYYAAWKKVTEGTGSPNTGDDSNVALVVALVIMSLMAAGGLTVASRRQSK